MTEKEKWAPGYQDWEYSNEDMETYLSRRDSSGVRTLMSPYHIASARSALNEWQKSEKSKGNRAHFNMLLSGATLPDHLIKTILAKEAP